MLVVHLLKTEKEFMQTGNTNYIHKNDLGKAFFSQHDMAYEETKLLKLLVIQNVMAMKEDWLH